MRVFETTTSTISIGWDRAEGPVQQYKIEYAPLTGDPITEFVSKSIYLVIHSFNTFQLRIFFLSVLHSGLQVSIKSILTRFAFLMLLVILYMIHQCIFF